MMLIRMTLTLCAGIFAAMAFGGEDSGQKRFGLVRQAPALQSAAVVQVSESTAPDLTLTHQPQVQTKVSLASFVPDAPVMEAPAQSDFAVKEDTSLEKFAFVGANSANVRQGPGKEHAVIGRVAAGQQVQVLSQEGDWSYITTDDGAIEGYIASRLLQG